MFYFNKYYRLYIFFTSYNKYHLPTLPIILIKYSELNHQLDVFQYIILYNIEML